MQFTSYQLFCAILIVIVYSKKSREPGLLVINYYNQELSMSTIKSMDLVWIVSNDIEKSKAFFSRTLGLEIATDTENWLEYKTLSGTRLGIGKSCEEWNELAGQNAVVTFTVSNIEQAKAEFEKKGVTFLSAIIEVPGHVKMALFTDPDDNKFQIVEVLDKL